MNTVNYLPYKTAPTKTAPRSIATNGRSLETNLNIRCKKDQLVAWNDAACAAGLDRSSWIRSILDRAAKRAAR